MYGSMIHKYNFKCISTPKNHYGKLMEEKDKIM